jgi:hypothetical protein
VQVVAVREKLFPELSEDCWLFYAEGAGGHTDHIAMTVLERFVTSNVPPQPTVRVPLVDWRTTWNRRLRPFLLSAEARALYAELADHPGTSRLGDLASVGIGYVSGANDFFHLRPSEATRWRIPPTVLQPAIRNVRMLSGAVLNRATLDRLIREDAPIHLLRLRRGQEVPHEVSRYLDSEMGQRARMAYKCRVRDPWYAVPDVKVPHYFLSYMSGRTVGLVRNDAWATCPNTLHFQLSCEIEGHPLGGGMLKLEPREAARLAIPDGTVLANLNKRLAREAITELQRWRHYAPDQRYPHD